MFMTSCSCTVWRITSHTEYFCILNFYYISLNSPVMSNSLFSFYNITKSSLSMQHTLISYVICKKYVFWLRWFIISSTVGMIHRSRSPRRLSALIKTNNPQAPSKMAATVSWRRRPSCLLSREFPLLKRSNFFYNFGVPVQIFVRTMSGIRQKSLRYPKNELHFN